MLDAHGEANLMDKYDVRRLYFGSGALGLELLLGRAWARARAALSSFSVLSLAAFPPARYRPLSYKSECQE